MIRPVMVALSFSIASSSRLPSHSGTTRLPPQLLKIKSSLRIWQRLMSDELKLMIMLLSDQESFTIAENSKVPLPDPKTKSRC